MAAYRLVYDSCHLQADYQGPGSAQLRNPTLGNRAWATFTFFTSCAILLGIQSAPLYQKTKTLTISHKAAESTARNPTRVDFSTGTTKNNI